MENIIPRIEKLIQRTDLNDFEKNFLPSIKGYYEKKNMLSAGQIATLEKIEARYSDENLAIQKAWHDSWNDEKKKKFKTIVDYYSKNGYYFAATIGKVRANPDYIPTEKEYNSIVENKYAQRYLKNSQDPAKFQVGDLVQVRSRRGWEAGDLCIILEDLGIDSWVKGGRKYLVSFVDDNHTGKLIEADLKIAREKSVAKKNQ